MVDLRVKQISNFTSSIVDLQISRHPLRSRVVVVFNTTNYDIYKDATNVESSRVNKWAIVEKEKDLHYIQQLLDDDFLIDDDAQLPWMITMTLSGLPRLPKQDDVIIIDGLKFTVARVMPIHKRIKSVLTAFVYPERSEVVDPSKLVSVKLFKDGDSITSYKDYIGEELVLEIIYGGTPEWVSLDGINWEPFETRIVFTPEEEDENIILYVKESISSEVLSVVLP